jgi:hypothetical protein
MRKLIHSKFELDLSQFKISDTEENNWFSDSFFTKYSFPFEIDLVDDFNIATGFITEYNSQNVETYFDLLYVHNNKIEKAILEIESYEQRLSLVLRFGFEQLASFDKMLSELSLDKFTLPFNTTIYEHAQTVITKKFPEVNYNFPQIHVDKYDPEDEFWTGFEGIINNRVDGTFLINEVIGDETLNRNVMQPLPYWIHILQRGMIDGGYVLSGKILTDSRLQKACLFGDVDYFKKPSLQEDIYISQMSEDAAEINYNNSAKGKAAKYLYDTVLSTPGKYNISGTIKCLRRSNFGTYFFIKYRNVYIWTQRSSSTSFFQGTEFRDYDVNINFETIADLNPNDITIEGYQYFTEEQQIINLTISCIRVNDASGNAIPTVTNENAIDLTRSVPKITFLEFIKVVKNWFNYDLTIVGNFAVMNPIEDAMNYNDTIDLSSKEVKYPYRKFSKGISFLLKFEDIDNSDFKYLPVFHNNKGVSNSSFVTDEKTITIEINALPLPILTKGTAQTAYAVENNDAKVYLVNYDGFFNGNNLAKPINEYEIPAVHQEYWFKWFDFRIFAQGFRLNFKAWEHELSNLRSKSKIYIYKRFHIIKSINKTEDKTELFSVEIETETLK